MPWISQILWAVSFARRVRVHEKVFLLFFTKTRWFGMMKEWDREWKKKIYQKFLCCWNERSEMKNMKKFCSYSWLIRRDDARHNRTKYEFMMRQHFHHDEKEFFEFIDCSLKIPSRTFVFILIESRQDEMNNTDYEFHRAISIVKEFVNVEQWRMWVEINLPSHLFLKKNMSIARANHWVCPSTVWEGTSTFHWNCWIHVFKASCDLMWREVERREHTCW